MTAQLQSPASLSAPLSIRKFRVGDGDPGITATIKIMQSVVSGKEGIENPYVRKAALCAVRGTARGMSEIASIFQWVKDNIEFRGEAAETIQTPLVTLQLGAGDCDDHSTLLAAMYQSLGYETRFNTVSTGGDPDEFSHVYVEVQEKTTGRWLPVDTTVRQSYPGWTVPHHRMQIRAANPAALRNRGLFTGLICLGILFAGGAWLTKNA